MRAEKVKTKTILLGVTGSIAAYKAVGLARRVARGEGPVDVDVAGRVTRGEIPVDVDVVRRMVSV